ncbi:brefeldin A-inhibited guanine nucleotide-exchange protein 2-like isoform X2 [Zophobas morio]|uniref:brefeldin A-inhibited guanine nucleotide-exchange protein 2-like isoform X2 n=1 Tax=Zophobas morio TaxID=2755281 RepID=UPI003082F14B
MVEALDCLQKIFAWNSSLIPTEDVVYTICDCWLEERTEPLSLQVVKALLTAVTCAQSQLTSGSVLRAFQTCFDIFVASKSASVQTAAKATLTQILSSLLDKVKIEDKLVESKIPTSSELKDLNADAGEIPEEAGASSPSPAPSGSSGFSILACLSQWEQELQCRGPVDQTTLNALLVFRLLCLLSFNHVQDAQWTGSEAKMQQPHGKILSLELLLVALGHCTPALSIFPPFVDSIKKHLCISLLRNGTSQNTFIFKLSLSIFMLLLGNFRRFLKPQIEIIFKNVFLLILESPTSSFRHKWLILQALASICGDPQMIVDLHVNYDCDLSMDNIFIRLVGDLGKLAQGRQSSELGATPREEKDLKFTGLACLKAILGSMSEWIRLCEEKYSESTAVTSVSETAPAVTPCTLKKHDDHEHFTVDDLESMETRRKTKELIERCIREFNSSPKEGLRLMQNKGLLGEDACSVARFLLGEDRLDKAMIGELLGDHEDYCREIMLAFVDSLDFSGMDFLPALRHFLGNFRLPGEAQKIDRLMEKFAARYYENNRDVFAHADTAYVLAFSVIILATDLHNKNVKRKMTKDEFVRNNRGINDQKDLPRDFLENIYDSIAAEGIRTKGGRFLDTRITYSASELTNEKTRNLLYRKQMERALEALSDTLLERSQAPSEFITATRVEHVKVMFSATWAVFLASISIALSTTAHKNTWKLCLGSFKSAIHIGCFFGMELERGACVSSLAKFTTLLSSDTPLMEEKQFACLITLLSVAHREANFLESSWYDILWCISRLECAQPGLFKSHDSREKLLRVGRSASNSQMTRKHSGKSVNLLFSHASGKEEDLNELHWQSVIQPIQFSVERIFSNSLNLTGDAILEFVRQCCALSAEELQSSCPPRMYMLQKIVEVSHYNMDRIRLEWSRIWTVLGSHFNKAGCMLDQTIALFAVDSLRQLSMKFLERGEFAHFHFQKDFLRPFEYIMANNEEEKIRDMIICCMSHFVQLQANNLKSGWKNIFCVLSLAAWERNHDLVSAAFDIFRHVHQHHLAAISPGLDKISMETMPMIQAYALEVHQKSKDNRISPWIDGWLPLMLTLHRIVMRCSIDLRTRALNITFELLRAYGDCFTQQNWVDLFHVFFRLFDDQRLPAAFDEKKVWVETTCTVALFPMMETITQHFAILAPPVLGSFLERLQWCLEKGSGLLATSAVQCLSMLVLRNCGALQPAMWELIVRRIISMFETTMPHELMNFRPPEATAEGAGHTLSECALVKCVVQLELLHAVEDILLPQRFDLPTNEAPSRSECPSRGSAYEYLSTEYVTALLQILLKSHNFAESFNANLQQRQLLLKAGCLKKLPHLLKQEKLSQRVYIAVLLRIYEDHSRQDVWGSAEEQLISIAVDAINTCIEEQSTSNERARSTSTGNLILLLRGLLRSPSEKFRTHIARYYRPLVSLLCLEIKNSTLRCALGEIFLRITREYICTGGAPF